MINLLLALMPVGIVLATSEVLWRRGVIKGEKARKFIHVLAGVWMAFWPLYLPFDSIVILGVAALVLLVYSRITQLFHSIYAVRRKTYGDILYAVSLILCALVAKQPWIFVIAILFLAIADGGAAVIGRYFGSKNSYRVFGTKHLQKSVVGTSAYVVLAILSIVIGAIVGGSDVISRNMIQVFLVLPLLSALIENTTPFGLDNIVTPLVAVVFLNSLL